MYTLFTRTAAGGNKLYVEDYCTLLLYFLGSASNLRWCSLGKLTIKGNGEL